MNDMEHMTHFIRGLKTPTIMLFDSSIGGTLRKNWIWDKYANWKYVLEWVSLKWSSGETKGCSCSWFTHNIISLDGGIF